MNNTESSMTSSLSDEISSNKCPKCGTISKSGTPSCCSRGGAWFKNCGHVGVTKFDHTWAEGIQACKEPLTLTNLIAVSSSNKCHKCGTTKKFGKRSCCARGGAW